MDKVLYILVAVMFFACAQSDEVRPQPLPMGSNGDRFIYKLCDDPWEKKIIWNGHDSNKIVTVYDSYDSSEDGRALHSSYVQNNEQDTVKFWQLYQKISADKKYSIFSYGWSGNPGVFDNFNLSYHNSDISDLLRDIKDHYKK